MTKKQKSIPPLSRKELLKCSLEYFKKREKDLRYNFKAIKDDKSLDLMVKFRKMRTIKSAVVDCVWAIEKVTDRDTYGRYKKLIPTLKYLRLYMDEAAESLNDLKDDLQVPVTYFIRCPMEDDIISGQSLIDGYLGNFQTNTLQKEGRDLSSQHDFSLNFRCYKEDIPDIHFFAFREIEASVPIFKQFLQDHNSQFEFSKQVCSDRKNVKYRFNVKPVVNIEFKFEGNPETGTIDLTIQNGWGLGKKGEFGTVKLYGIPSTIKENGSATIEALIRTIMRCPSRLFDWFELIEEKQTPPIQALNVVSKKTKFTKVNIAEILDNLQEDNQKIKTDYQDIKKDNLVIKEAMEIVKEEARKSFEELEETVKNEHVQTRNQSATMFGWLFAALSNRRNGKA